MKEENKVVILDADGLIALINTDDANHKQAIKISGMLLEKNITVLIPVIVVVEAVTALKRAIQRPDLAKVLVEMYTDGQIAVIDVPADILPLAVNYFDSHDSKQNTMFDAVICAFVQRYNAAAVFSFDKGYIKKNIPLVTDVFQV